MRTIKEIIIRVNEPTVLQIGLTESIYLKEGDKLIIEDDSTENIKVKHPGLLDVPEGNHFWEMPLSHYISLGKSKGKRAVMDGLLNLERWDKNKDPSISAHARSIINALEKNTEWQDL